MRRINLTTRFMCLYSQYLDINTFGPFLARATDENKVLRDISVIADNKLSTDVVKGRLLKLDSGHVGYVLNCLKNNTSKVVNIKKYMLAALFNAPATITSYYQAEVNHDLVRSP